MMDIIGNIPVFGMPDGETVAQMHEAMKYGAITGALMADHHIGYSVPIGGVIGYKDSICVNGVGFDIGCGNKAVRLDVDADIVRKNIYRNMNEIQKHISFGVGRTNAEKIEHDLFDDDIWNDIDIMHSLKQKARDQLGTVGSGNHYVDVFLDESSRVWVGVHFGSRGLGHSICTHFIKAASGKDGIHAPPVVLHEDSDLGSQYIKCMQMAGRYAYAGRDWVCARVARILQGNIVEEVHNHHNFAWKETHNDTSMWVVRKGATPNKPGDRSFVGGSMGDSSFILEGVESLLSKQSLYSTIHGAGRIMSRTDAKSKTHRKTGEIIRAGQVSRADMDEWITKYDVELRGGDVDESPHVYKRIEQVLFAHRETVKVCHRLKPIGVCMASNRDVDPYKD